MIIGIDDTDSREGMCTTYLAALLIDELSAFGTLLADPLLIRLNPTIPHKTRGNASVAICIDCADPQAVIEHVVSRVSSFSRLECDTTNPGVAFVMDGEYEQVKQELGAFFRRAVTDVISIDDAKDLAAKLGLEFRTFKNGRGLIGSLAACGAMLNPGWDHTYEYLAYRKQDVWGSSRSVDIGSVYGADRKTYPNTWDSVDFVNDLVVCVPHSPDPVLFGIRGNSKSSVSESAELIISESVERSRIFKTNQGTDMHLLSASSISEIEGMHSYILEGTVQSKAETIRGGHSIFVLEDTFGDTIDCAAFEPTKNFREIIRNLLPGDGVVVYGSVMDGTLNVEKINILSIVEDFEKRNPECPSCGKRMKSAGAGQGYRCKKCGTSATDPELIKLERGLKPGFYEVPPCARRHLAKPLVRSEDSEVPLFPGR
ncbi:tRNA(Ile)(2)-agmatinylcytidine synthase [Methanolobus sp. ZRKC3]|uniref:TiaS agmantine-binding domain-containing protein n=1 Tax=Methanolobus sp. ZRKC3 TaxID=3125786 RepID=UPI0032555D75